MAEVKGQSPGESFQEVIGRAERLHLTLILTRIEFYFSIGF